MGDVVARVHIFTARHEEEVRWLTLHSGYLSPQGNSQFPPYRRLSGLQDSKALKTFCITYVFIYKLLLPIKPFVGVLASKGHIKKMTVFWKSAINTY